jgi:N-acetylmuramoyl-L-alanine amidase
MRRYLLLSLALVAGAFLGWSEAGAESLSIVAGGPKGGLRGEVPVIVGEGGTRYVPLDRLASLLGVKPAWSAGTRTATLAHRGTRVQLVRDRPRVLVDGKPVTLGAPPRVLSAGWVVPEEFLTRVLPRLAPGVQVTRTPIRPPVRPARAPVVLEELRFRSYPSFTRIVLETSAAVEFRLEERAGEIRARVSGLGLPAPQSEEVGDGLVREVRLTPAGRDAELVVVLEGARGPLRTLVLEDPHRLVLDVHRRREDALRGRPGIQAEPLTRIVLDAGHGGHDPGAIGPGGLMEKELVLDVTLRLARLLEEGLGIKPVLTRSGDHFVALRERTQLANRERAQLFVSIHANAHRSSGYHGVETYFLSSEATDDEARQVAAIENGVIQLEPGYSPQRMDALKTILWDLAQSEFQIESSHLAEAVQDALTDGLRIPNRGVKQAGFYVLGGAAMPAILVEIGFLTNRKEEARLRDPRYREQVARAIYAGLVEYKRRYDQKMGVPRAAAETSR